MNEGRLEGFFKPPRDAKRTHTLPSLKAFPQEKPTASQEYTPTNISGVLAFSRLTSCPANKNQGFYDDSRLTHKLSIRRMKISF
jgi:hypothetical protein